MFDPLSAFRPEPWTEYASCAQADPEAWYPEPHRQTTHQAKAICHQCPVLDLCREHIMRTEGNERHGIFGGLSPLERRTLAREEMAA